MLLARDWSGKCVFSSDSFEVLKFIFSLVFFFLLNIVFTFVLKSVPKKKENKEFMLCTRKKVNTFLNKITKLCTKEWSERQRMETFLCLHTCCPRYNFVYIVAQQKFPPYNFFLNFISPETIFLFGNDSAKVNGNHPEK